jgi:TPR repeat protein
LTKPPINIEYAERAIHYIKNVFLDKNDQNKAFRARLDFLKGIIYKKGFASSKPHSKQALVCLTDAANLNYTQAFEHLGDYYYEEALREPGLISQNPKFTSAVINYIRL